MSKKKKTKAEPKACLIKDCKRPVRGRGLCGTHYQSAEHLVRTKTATWEELEAMKMAAPAVVRSSGYRELLNKKREAAKKVKPKTRATKPKVVPTVPADQPQPTAA